MTSEQKYEGKGQAAQNSSPAVNHEPQTPPTADERFVVDPETLVMVDTETGERFTYVAEPGKEVSNE